MLKKLIKYDIKYLFSWCRYLWLIGLTAGVTVVVMSALAVKTNNELFSLLAVLGVIALLLFNFASQVCVYIRYYKSIATDEAYLTFTLPVSRKSFLLSKLITSLIEAFARYLYLALFAIALFLFVPYYDAPKDFINQENLMGLRNFFTEAWATVGAWMILYLLLIILFLAIITVIVTGGIYLAITLGSNLTQKNKLLVTLGVLYLVYLISSYVFPITLAIPMVTVIAPVIDMILALPTGMICAAWFVGGMIICLTFAALACAVIFINLGILERKLNLQ